MQSRSIKCACGLIEVLVSLALVMILLAFLLPLHQIARNAAYQSANQNGALAKPGHATGPLGSPRSSQSESPFPVEKAVSIGFLIAVLAALGVWLKRLMASVDARARLAVCQVLSEGSKMSRKDLIEAAKRTDWALRIVPDAINDALANLHANGQIRLDKGDFQMLPAKSVISL
jgi:hypothetical protein